MVDLAWDHHTLTTMGMTVVRILTFFEGTIAPYKLCRSQFYLLNFTIFLRVQLDFATCFLNACVQDFR